VALAVSDQIARQTEAMDALSLTLQHGEEMQVELAKDNGRYLEELDAINSRVSSETPKEIEHQRVVDQLQEQVRAEREVKTTLNEQVMDLINERGEVSKLLENEKRMMVAEKEEKQKQTALLIGYTNQLEQREIEVQTLKKSIEQEERKAQEALALYNSQVQALQDTAQQQLEEQKQLLLKTSDEKDIALLETTQANSQLTLELNQVRDELVNQRRELEGAQQLKELELSSAGAEEVRVRDEKIGLLQIENSDLAQKAIEDSTERLRIEGEARNQRAQQLALFDEKLKEFNVKLLELQTENERLKREKDLQLAHLHAAQEKLKSEEEANKILAIAAAGMEDIVAQLTLAQKEVNEAKSEKATATTILENTQRNLEITISDLEDAKKELEALEKMPKEPKTITVMEMALIRPVGADIKYNDVHIILPIEEKLLLFPIGIQQLVNRWKKIENMVSQFSVFVRAGEARARVKDMLEDGKMHNILIGGRTLEELLARASSVGVGPKAPVYLLGFGTRIMNHEDLVERQRLMAPPPESPMPGKYTVEATFSSDLYGTLKFVVSDVSREDDVFVVRMNRKSGFYYHARGILPFDIIPSTGTAKFLVRDPDDLIFQIVNVDHYAITTDRQLPFDTNMVVDLAENVKLHVRSSSLETYRLETIRITARKLFPSRGASK